MSGNHLSDKAKGLAKEVAGKATGSDEMVKEGQAQQQKAQKADEAEELEEAAAQKRREAAGHAGAEAAQRDER